jgi:hypothetical protein
MAYYTSSSTQPRNEAATLKLTSFTIELPTLKRKNRERRSYAIRRILPSRTLRTGKTTLSMDDRMTSDRLKKLKKRHGAIRTIKGYTNKLSWYSYPSKQEMITLDAMIDYREHTYDQSYRNKRDDQENPCPTTEHEERIDAARNHYASDSTCNSTVAKTY